MSSSGARLIMVAKYARMYVCTYVCSYLLVINNLRCHDHIFFLSLLSDFLLMFVFNTQVPTYKLVTCYQSSAVFVSLQATEGALQYLIRVQLNTQRVLIKVALISVKLQRAQVLFLLHVSVCRSRI